MKVYDGEKQNQKKKKKNEKRRFFSHAFVFSSPSVFVPIFSSLYHIYRLPTRVRVYAK